MNYFNYLIAWVLIGMVLIIIKLFMIHTDVKVTLKTFTAMLAAVVAVQDMTQKHLKEKKDD